MVKINVGVLWWLEFPVFLTGGRAAQNRMVQLQLHMGAQRYAAGRQTVSAAVSAAGRLPVGLSNTNSSDCQCSREDEMSIL
jgi:hypothetical protein